MRRTSLILVLAAVCGLAAASEASAQFRWPILPGTAPPKNAPPRTEQPARGNTRALSPIEIPAPAATGPDWRAADPENTLVIDTNKGRIIVELEPAIAPATVQRIKTLTRRGFYNGRTFFRVIDDFMAQTGDPEDTGLGESDLPNLAPEFTFQRGRDIPFTPIGPVNTASPVGFVNSVPVSTQPDAMMALMASGKVNAQGLFCSGVLGMARADEPDSGNSQFFLMRQSTPALDGKYTAFGRVLVGLDVVRAIKTGEPVPQPQDRMTTVRLLADLPAGQRPDVQVLRTAGPTFRAYADKLRFDKGAAFDICDLEIQTLVR